VKRGDVVLMAAGKPRPAIVVQADGITTPVTIILCPVSSYLVDAPIYRPVVEPDQANGLTKTSQFMVDKVGPIGLDKTDKVIGSLSADDMRQMEAALALVLGLQ